MIDLLDSTDPDLCVAAEVLATLDACARAAGVSYLVLGATARNILCAGIFGRLPNRATRDVDIAVAVPTWEFYRKLTAGLTRRGSGHAFTVATSGVPIEVDVVPYGGVEAPDRTVTLPDDHRLNVLGVQEAFTRAQTARLPGNLPVPVPTIAGLALLKLVAWSDRRLQTRHDALDLDEILGWYADGPFLDALYDLDVTILGNYDFDPLLAGAYRLGRDVTALASAQARAAVLAVLDDEDLRARLANDMGRASARDPLRLIAFRDGVLDG